MSLGLVFWVLMLIWFVIHGALVYQAKWELMAGSFYPFILFLLLGWQVFGAPIK